MTKSSNPDLKSGIKNPLIWVGLIVAGLIVFIFLSSSRGVKETAVESLAESSGGAINRSLLIPPGMQARQNIEQIKQSGEPFPLMDMYQKAESFMRQGSLADAHLLYFFSAREGHIPAMMKMAEMADPTLFRSENSLLDKADPMQAYKWYQKALKQGDKQAEIRLATLKQWALTESENGNPYARQLLLTIN